MSIPDSNSATLATKSARYALATVLMSAALLVGAAAAHAQAAICFRSTGPTCRDLNQFASNGIAYIKFVPNSLARTSTTTSWQLLGFFGQSATSDPIRITAIVEQVVSGENAVLALQETICEKVRESHLGCTRDLLDGNWSTRGRVNNGPMFSVTFANESYNDLAANGTFLTRRWACQTTVGTEPAEIEVQCRGSYSTSLRLLYLLNDSQLSLTNVICTPGGIRSAVSTTATLPVCPTQGSVFPASTWLPFQAVAMRYRQTSPTMITVQGTQGPIPLYVQGWQP